MAQLESRPARISVITCCWNSEPYIAQCIASVQAQQGVNVEHVFVDGGSTDGTLQRVQALGGITTGSVRWVTDVRGGIANAMNVGVQLSTGEVIAHLHGDDYYLRDDVLAEVAGHFERSGCDWLFGRIVSDVDGKLVPERFVCPLYSLPALRRGNFVPHPATFVKRSVFQRFGGFRADYRYAMDYEFWLRIAPSTSVVQLDRPLAAFRRHAGSASTANAQRALREDFRARCAHSSRVHLPMDLARFAVRSYRIARIT